MIYKKYNFQRVGMGSAAGGLLEQAAHERKIGTMNLFGRKTGFFRKNCRKICNAACGHAIIILYHTR